MTGILELQLFKNAYSDNHNRIKKFADLTAQNDYYDNLSDKIEIEGNYNKIGDNIRIVGDYATLSNYNYGRFKYHNIWFYFSVVEYLIVNEQKLEIVYNLDYYETARYQYDVSLGKGTIQNITTEYSAGKIAKIPKNENGLGLMKKTSLVDFRDSFEGVIFYVYHGDSRADINGIYVLDFSTDPLSSFIQRLLDNSYINKLVSYLSNLHPDWSSHFDMNDIRGCWLIPRGFINKIKDPISGANWLNVGGATDPLLYRHSGYSSVSYNDFKYYKYGEIKRTDNVYTVFMDTESNILWEIPTGDYVNGSKTVEYNIDISASSCDLRINFTIANGVVERLVYPLPSVTVYNNTYLEYTARQRQTDIELRHTNNEQQLVNGLVNIGSSVIGGAVGGAMAGGKAGAGMGAGAGFISGYIGSVGGYAVNEYYGNIQQNIIDNQYKRASNNLLLHGDGVISRLTHYFGFYDVSYSGDLGGDRTDKIIETYGYEINLHYPDVQSYIDYLQTVNGDSYIMGNFEVNGHIPDNWKKQIKDRFNGGVNYG